MRILVTGSSGLIGSALVGALGGAGHSVIRLVRRAAATDEVRLDPAVDPPFTKAGEDQAFDAVVHLD